jgi:signal transduction histidine kinase
MSQSHNTADGSAGVLSLEMLTRLKDVPILATLDSTSLHCLDGATERWIEPDHVIAAQGEFTSEFWILLEGKINVLLAGADADEHIVYVIQPGVSFGEVPLLAAMPSPGTLRAAEPCHLLQLSEDQFWKLMTECPGVRKAILGNMAMRLAKAQSATFQQEKMAALGTLAAGLMHELNNPGTAARRASTQLRENLLRMHKLTAKFARTPMTDEQKGCMYDLQEYALSLRPTLALTTLEQADAEEALADWMRSAEIEDAWRLAPTLVSIGIDAQALECARSYFSGPVFSDAISWLEALVSSMQLVGTIEESIGRVTELVSAVKSYAYEGRGQRQSIDVNRSIHATLVVLGHKLREKQLTIDKDLSADLPLLHTDCHGINQIWTNLLDNAIDAAPPAGRIGLRTWSEPHKGEGAPGQNDICILVADNGNGIPPEIQAQIFETFYTTKPVGVGTGLGLGIVHRIVEQFGGTIHFSSIPGQTEFLVRLPNRTA